MSSTRSYLLIGLALVIVFATAQALLRTSDEPAGTELVPWEPWSEVQTDESNDRAVLLEFSADWCKPCRRLKVTLFRDPRFVQLLERLELRPARIEYDADDALTWQKVSDRFGVAGYPAMVVVAPDGTFSSPITGALPLAEYQKQLTRTVAQLRFKHFFHSPDEQPDADRNRLVLRHFDTWYYLDRSQRTDWRYNPSAAFSLWVRDHIDLVSDDFRNFPPAYQYYTEHEIKTVPTLVLEDWRGFEIARFEGQQAVEAAPAEIARIAREQRIDVPDPPAPYAATSR